MRVFVTKTHKKIILTVMTLIRILTSYFNWDMWFNIGYKNQNNKFLEKKMLH
jgi:hypothetical protein